MGRPMAGSFNVRAVWRSPCSGRDELRRQIAQPEARDGEIGLGTVQPEVEVGLAVEGRVHKTDEVVAALGRDDQVFEGRPPAPEVSKVALRATACTTSAVSAAAAS